MTAVAVLVALAAPAAPTPAEVKASADWPAAIRDRAFGLDEAHTGAEACAIAARRAGAAVDVSAEAAGGGDITIRVSAAGGKVVTVVGHGGSAFAVRGSALYVADYSPVRSGCEVVAYDLLTGAKAWTRPLAGIGPIAHSKYRNRVSLAVEKHPTADAWAVVVAGRETAGRYVEVLDPATGKEVAHRPYDRDDK